ncbi:hypothetical protein SETIT_4G268500v2 [Setaria italica]|uniref:Receptor kinase-like protein Xa21 n=1 Tax=Setaria italica TaxID=4555 RepID=K3Y360_SETIT|nr:putative receptor-like protein kinase At3g47110 [Setaria italica]RCV23055.1 hypothetical protein SETIT_4G268500v2 [Setaria italica]
MALLLLLQLGALAVAAAAGTDRDALLAFKAAVTDPSGKLRSWNDTAHFCRWPGVTCAAGRVTSLDVSGHGLTGTLSPAVGDLERLEVLNLTDNGVSGRIPASLGRLQHLSYLSLCDNKFEGEIPDALRNCSALAVAFLNNNHLTGGVPGWLDSLRNLTVLWLGHNALSGRIPPSLGNITWIRALQFDQNLLEGGIPEALSRLPDLRVFTVYQNRLTGEIPPGFFNMSSLQEFSIANNDFHGQLPADAGARWPDLRYLFLGGNNLSGPIPASLAMASSLQALSLASNSFTGHVPPGIGRLTAMESLELSNNKLTASDAGGWEFLEGLTNSSGLVEIYLDGNNLGGAMPGSVARLSPELRTLSLGGNRISGVIPSGIGNLVGLQTLDLSSNLLTGIIPEGIGRLKNLQELRLQENKLTGPMPSSIGYLSQLLSLDLSSNSLNGSIPSSIGNLQRLTLINLSGNKLTGRVPRQLFLLPSLSWAMDLSDNRLDGRLPHEVGQLVQLAIMALSGNRFSGEVPAELGSCQSLDFLGLDRNLFTGSIPSSLSRLKGLRKLNLTSNELTGSIPPELSQMTGLQELYLSRNGLSGGIPAGLENVSSLIELDVSHNHLEGRVPTLGVFANTTGFKMTGNGALCGGAAPLRLPPCRRTKSTRVDHLILKIALPIVGFALCFAMLFALLRCRRMRRRSRIASDTTTRSMLNGNNYPRVSYAELAKATEDFSNGNLIGAGKYGSVYQGILPLKTKGSFELQDVVVAVKVFHLQQIGASKTFLSECEALRRVKHRNLISIVTCCSSIDAEGNDFRALVFDFMPNYSLDRWLHPSLLDVTEGRVLSIIQRFNIAVDIADALKYLHSCCEPPIIHCDLKPGNVLLGEDMTACIGDFGLAKLLLDPESHGFENTESTIGIRGTIGYVAPEYGTSGKVSTYGDVYSFGIMLLEIFVGKAPTSDAFRDGLTLPEFVGEAFPDKIERILDPALLLEEELFSGVVSSSSEESELCATVYDCLVSAIRVGLSCCRKTPCQRMAMSDAAAELCLIRDACARAYGQ